MGQAAFKAKTSTAQWRAQRELKNEHAEKRKERKARLKEIDSKWAKGGATPFTSLFGKAGDDSKAAQAQAVAEKYEKK